MKSFRSIVPMVFVAVSATQELHAQSAELLPRAGAWGVEASAFGGGSLLKFTSPSTAWLAGLQISRGHSAQDGAFSMPDANNWQVAGQLGHRWYAANSADAHLRTTYGVGMTGNRFHASSGDITMQRGWQLGGYGELGLTWFFTPHFSLAGLSNLAFTGGKSTQAAGTIVQGGEAFSSETTSTTWAANFNLVRLIGAVYF